MTDEIRKYATGLLILFLLLAGSGTTFASPTWQELLASSDSLRRQGRLDSAIALASQALNLVELERGADDTAAGRALYKMGVANARLGRYSAAESLITRTLVIYEAQLDSNHATLGSALNAMGLILNYQGRYSEAEPYYLRSLRIKEAALGPGDPKLANSLNNFGALLFSQGKNEEAEPYFVRSLAIRESALGQDSPAVGRSLNRLGDLYLRMGRYADAERSLTRARTIWDRSEDVPGSDLAATLSSLASLHNDLGEYAAAGPLYEQAIEIWERSEHPELYVGLHNLAHNRVMTGHYAEAEALFKRTVELIQQLLGDNHRRTANALNSLSDLYVRMGRFEDAESACRKSLAILEDALGPQHHDVALTLNNLAYVLTLQDRSVEARPLLERALEICRNLESADYHTEATVVASLAELHYGESEFTPAESLLHRAIDLVERGLSVEHPKIGHYLSNLAETYRRQNKTEPARNAFARALSVIRSSLGEAHPELGRCLRLSSAFHSMIGEHRTALDQASLAFGLLQRSYDRNVSVLPERDALEFSRLLHISAANYLSCHTLAPETDQSDQRSVCDVILASKGCVTEVVFERAKSWEDETDSTIVSIANQYRRARHAVAREYFSASASQNRPEVFDSMITEVERLEAELSLLSASFRERLDSRRISSADIAGLLPDGAVLLDYFQYRQADDRHENYAERYAVAVFDDMGQATVVDLGEAAIIDGLVSRYRRHMLDIAASGKYPSVIHQTDYRDIGRALYDSVLAPVQDLIAREGLLILAPDGSLNLISFAGLIDQDGAYLIETRPIHYVSSGRELARRPVREMPGRGLLALGAPDFDARAGSRVGSPVPVRGDEDMTARNASEFRLRSGCGNLSSIEVEPLPRTRDEVEQIRRTWSASSEDPVTVLTGSMASEENFKALAPGHRVIHLATHGYFMRDDCPTSATAISFEQRSSRALDNPLLLSGLLLAGSNLHGAGADQEGAEDGILSAEEISGMKLSGTELVVLSACETGLGDIQLGEGLYGLRRAFRIAGVGTVVSALWPIPDDAAAELMSALHERYYDTIPDHLRRLQVERIRALREANARDHPYTWAAFIASGDMFHH